MEKRFPKIVIAGAGIAGIRCAVELAELGYDVVLVDKAPAFGGILTQLDHQFPDNHCGMCKMLPMLDRDKGPQTCLRKGLFHENIQILSAARLETVQGTLGKLTVSVRQTPAGVLFDKCIDCKECETICPVSVPDQFNENLASRKAIYRPIAHQSNAVRIIDWQACTLCGLCRDKCPTQAIKLEKEDRIISLEPIAAVIDASGVSLFDPDTVDVYATKDLKDVVTATAFERMVSQSGPFQGRIQCPSDGRPAEKIAWVQCVGSRNITIGADYCSNACCMFAIKEAVLAKDRLGNRVDTTIFYMDLRTFGRDYQRYRDQAEMEKGVKFVRCRIHSIGKAVDSDRLLVTYVDAQGQAIDALFDLVVLSNGRRPDQETLSWTGQEGVFPIRPQPELTDISENVIIAGSICDQVIVALSQSGLSLQPAGEPNKGPGDLVESQKQILIVNVISDGLVAGFDSDLLEKKVIAQFPQIKWVKQGAWPDSQEQTRLFETVLTASINRLVLIVLNEFDLIRLKKMIYEKTGIPKAFIKGVDISRLMQTSGAQLTENIAREIQIDVLKLQNTHLPREKSILASAAITQSALVVGSGPAGLTAALSLALKQIPVTIIENQDRIGGNSHSIFDPQIRPQLDQLIADVKNHPLITIIKRAVVKHRQGSPGRFMTQVLVQASDGQEPQYRSIEHGAVILAMGGKAAPVQSYQYGRHEHIVSLMELEHEVYNPKFSSQDIKTIVMIQCVDSRQEPYNYCSRICCIKAVKIALQIKAQKPETQIYVFYRDMMTYGTFEAHYTEARRQGIMFIPYEKGKGPEVIVDSGTIMVKAMDPILGEMMTLKPDRLSLASRLTPHIDNDLTQVYDIDLTRDGFVKEADYKWRPVDTVKEGVFVCGLAKGPCNAIEAMAQGRAAAARAFRILSRKIFARSDQVAQVRLAYCSVCELCIPECPYGARTKDFETGKILVDEASCQGCGRCAAICPNSASVLCGNEEKGIMDVIEAAW